MSNKPVAVVPHDHFRAATDAVADITALAVRASKERRAIAAGAIAGRIHERSIEAQQALAEARYMSARSRALMNAEAAA